MQKIPAPPLPTFLRIQQVADALAVDPRTVKNRIADGTIPAVKVGGCTLVPASFLTNLDAQAHGSAA